MARPQTFTSRERLIKAVVAEIWSSGLTFKQIAEQTNKSPSTIRKLASGDTIWPRPETLFPLLQVLKLHIEVVRDIDRKKR